MRRDWKIRYLISHLVMNLPLGRKGRGGWGGAIGSALFGVISYSYVNVNRWYHIYISTSSTSTATQLPSPVQPMPG